MRGARQQQQDEGRPPFGVFIVLLSACLSLLLCGGMDLPSTAVFLVGSGLGLILLRPVVLPPIVPLVLGLLSCALAATAFLPATWFGLPEWRAAFPPGGVVELAGSVAPQPWIAIYWWLLLAAATVVALGLLAAPLGARHLRLFLHVVAAFVFLYAVLAIAARQTGWSPSFAFPFPASGNFGFLANRNHTASLLAAGAVISVGLMYGEAVRQNRLSAFLAAIWASAPLAGVLFFSVSRAGVVVLALGLVVWCGGLWRRNRVHARGAVVAIVAIGVVAGGLFAIGGGGSRDRLWKLAERTFGAAGEGRGPVDFRAAVFRDALSMIADEPLTGAGIGQFSSVFPQYIEASASHAPVTHPESDWLLAAAESGVPFAVCLALLVAWFGRRCWQGLPREGGLLRWTAASAVLAVVAHGLVDVPWHRVQLGWFFLVIAAVAVPIEGAGTGRPRLLLRLTTALAGLALVAAGAWLAREISRDRLPAPFRWAAANDKLNAMLEDYRDVEGRELATATTKWFPLDYRTYYWRARFTGFFKGAQAESAQSLDAMLRVQPVFPEAADLKAGFFRVNGDQEGEAVALAEWARRMAAADRAAGDAELGYAGPKLNEVMYHTRMSPAMQAILLQSLLRMEPLLAARGATAAADEAAESFFSALPDPKSFLDPLPDEVRRRLLGRWASLPSAAGALAYMDAAQNEAEPPGPYWWELAEFRARNKDFQGATESVSLWWQAKAGQGQGAKSAFAYQIEQLSLAGNTTAVRRLLKESLETEKPEPEKLAVATSWYADAGDWESAWKAASRLANEAKIGQ
jgi:O-antigen ligase